MLTRHELSEMRALVARLQRGPGSREDWANLAALTLIWQGDSTAMAIEAHGFEHFVATCEPVYERHGFGAEDYARIYARVCAAATRGRRDAVH